MKTYNKLMRIKYNNKLYDIFSDENHRKVFLEVKIINGVEKYYYISVSDYFCLNNIYNVKPNVYYYQNDNGEENNKKKFKYQLFVGFTLGVVTMSTIFGGVNAITNGKLFRGTKYTTGSFSENTITNVEQLEELFNDTVTFNDVRTTLSNNNNIPEKYRLYIEEYINRLEERMPQINLRCFNENLRKMEINVLEKHYNGNADASVGTGLKDTTMYIRSEYKEIEFEKKVFFHELTHTLRQANFDNGSLYGVHFSFGNENFGGHAFGEAFTEMTTQYLLSDDYKNFFADVYKGQTKEEGEFFSYEHYAKHLYQILKLGGNEYTLQDYFCYGVSNFCDYLENYGLSDLVDLYDVDLANYTGGIEAFDRSRISELEGRLFELRFKQELENGTSVVDALDLLYLFDKNDLDIAIHTCANIDNYLKQKYSIDVKLNEIIKDRSFQDKIFYWKDMGLSENLRQIKVLKNAGTTDYEIYQVAARMSYANPMMANLFLENNNEWQLRIVNKPITLSCKTTEISNPKITIYSNDRIVYDDYLYYIENDNLDSKSIYIMPTAQNGELVCRFAKYEDGEYIDIITGEELIYILEPVSLISLDIINDYDVKINADNFLKLDHVTNLIIQESSSIVEDEEIFYLYKTRAAIYGVDLDKYFKLNSLSEDIDFPINPVRR